MYEIFGQMCWFDTEYRLLLIVSMIVDVVTDDLTLYKSIIFSTDRDL